MINCLQMMALWISRLADLNLSKNDDSQNNQSNNAANTFLNSLVADVKKGLKDHLREKIVCYIDSAVNEELAVSSNSLNVELLFSIPWTGLYWCLED